MVRTRAGKGCGMTVQTYNGDCLEVMKLIPDKSVDMVLCDLPYGTTRNQWDSVIPMDALWEQYHRIVRGGGATVLFAQYPFNFVLGCSNLKEFRYQWIWRKNHPTGFLNANRQPMKCHEDVLVFCDQGAPYNPQVSQCAPRRLSGVSTTSTNYGKHHSMPTKMVTERMPWDVIDFDTNADEKIHPTQKPVPLCEYLIRTYTDEGMTVLDNCMGSGTTGVAAVQCNRNFIGIEKDPSYYQKAIERINKAEVKYRGRTTLEAFA